MQPYFSVVPACHGQVGAMEGLAVGQWPCPGGRGCTGTSRTSSERWARGGTRVQGAETGDFGTELLQRHGRCKCLQEQTHFPLQIPSPVISRVGSVHSDSIYLSKYIACLLIQAVYSLFLA